MPRTSSATPTGTAPMMPLWRALTVFRIVSWVYAAILAVHRETEAEFTRPLLAFGVIAVMAVWTLFTARRYLRTPPPGRLLLVIDVAVAMACLLATRLVLPSQMISTTLPVTWIAGPVIAWAVAHGRRAGLVSALVLGAGCLAVRGGFTQAGADEGVLLLLTGFVIGHVVRLLAVAEDQVRRATSAQAAAAERDRLARAVHDSVLQILALVQRRGTELGGPAAELGRLAGEQEAALRALVAAESRPVVGADGLGERTEADHGRTDLLLALTDLVSAGVGAAATGAAAKVTLSGPAEPVTLPARTALGLAAAVAAALDNVRKHAGTGAQAWILVEDEEDAVTVTVRDDGPGIPRGRLDRAAADGRLGVAQSIRGRVADLGGTARILSVPGQGTEIELRVPRR